MSSLTTKVIAAAGGVFMSVGLGAGIASANPDAAVLNSTCSYPQVIAALDAQDPGISSQLKASPIAVNFLQGLVSSPPGSPDRQQRINTVRAIPESANYIGLINSVATSCANY